MYNRPANSIRDLLHMLGVMLYRLGFARSIIQLRKKTPRVLLYHAVEDHVSPYTDRLGVSVSTAMFEANLKYLARHYNLITVEDLAKPNLPDNPVLITFDDGYTSVYDNALPLLRKYRMPACIYLIGCAVKGKLVWVNELNWALAMHPRKALPICQQFPDLLGLETRSQIVDKVKTHFSPANIRELSARLHEIVPFEKNHGLYSAPEQIEEMKKSDISFGFHTKDHYNLENCDKHELMRQLDPSDLNGIVESPSLAYPFGFFDSEAIGVANDNGFQSIMTVGNNNNRFSSSHVDRIEVFSADPATVFAKIEVEEPMIAAIRRVVLNVKSTRRWLHNVCFGSA